VSVAAGRDANNWVLHKRSTFIARAVFVCCAIEISRPRGGLLKLEMMRPIESSNLKVDGIVETCINVAEISRAREFYQSLFNFEAMVSDERFCALRAGPDVLLLFTHGGSNAPVVIRGGVIPPHETRGAGHTLPSPFPRTRSILGEHGCASVELRLNRKFSGSAVVPVCISGIRMPTCLSSPLLVSGRTIDPANISVSHANKQQNIN
jgi:hypothetical protein